MPGDDKVQPTKESTFIDHPDARARRTMLQLHHQHPKYVTQPKQSLLELLEILGKTEPEDDNHFHHLHEASRACDHFIDLVKNPDVTRGANELGKALALITHLVRAQLFKGQQQRTDLPTSTVALDCTQSELTACVHDWRI
jgi:hypothetical protein